MRMGERQHMKSLDLVEGSGLFVKKRHETGVNISPPRPGKNDRNYDTEGGENLASPLMSTPKRGADGDRENLPRFEPLFSEIEKCSPSTAFSDPIVRGATSTSRQSGSLRDAQPFATHDGGHSSLLYFGFVAVGEAQVLEKRLINQSGVQLRVRCHLEGRGLHQSGSKSTPFEILSVSAMSVEPNAELIVTVRYRPITNEENSDTRLVIEKTNGEYKKFSFKLLGYGGRADLRFLGGLKGTAVASPSGVIVLTPDIYPPLSAFYPSFFQFSLANYGQRSCFIAIKITKDMPRYGGDRAEEEIPRALILASPNKFIIRGREEGTNKKELARSRVTVRISSNSSLAEKHLGQHSVSLAECDCDFQVLVIWGEELQRQYLKSWEQRNGCIFSAHGLIFTDKFTGESASPTIEPDTCPDRPLNEENKEFENSLRLLRINVVNNQASFRMESASRATRISANAN